LSDGRLPGCGLPLELEYAIPTLEAEALIALREGSVIENTRYQLPHGDLTWEVDVFSGENPAVLLQKSSCAMNASSRRVAHDAGRYFFDVIGSLASS
jgi:CYTH domain-containing protein